MPNSKTSSLLRLFGDLKVRPKLMVLHNLFFLVLTCAVYFSIIPLFDKQVSDAQAREIAILRQTHTPAQDQNAPRKTYREAAVRAKLTLFLVLGSIYVLAVLVLESAIMPLYVYKPLQRMLDADSATQTGDRDRELIPPEVILGDEIGQIMRSRNESVSTLRRREEELAAALRRLEEQDRLVSLGLLSASVAHELNTPLAVLNGSIEKIIETTRDQQTLERLARMQRVAQRLQRISESLVDFSRVRNQQMGPLAIRPLIDEAWGLVAIDDKSATVEFNNWIDSNPSRESAPAPLPSDREAAAPSPASDRQTAAPSPASDRQAGAPSPASERQAAHSSPTPDRHADLLRNPDREGGDTKARDLKVIGNPDRLVQVFVNLLRNALNAVEPGTGKIDVRSRPSPRGIAISVEDNGRGIPADILPDIFDAFVTTRLDAHGTGLGLTVAEGIITQHGGTIAASNRTEGGAKLEVTLPAA